MHVIPLSIRPQDYPGNPEFSREHNLKFPQRVTLGTSNILTTRLLKPRTLTNHTITSVYLIYAGQKHCCFTDRIWQVLSIG